jgi:hypothetical protein
VLGLKLGLPTSIETISTPFNGLSYPNATTTYYEFPAREGMPPVTLTWYDGGLHAATAGELGDVKLVGEGGVLYLGDEGQANAELNWASGRACCRWNCTTALAASGKNAARAEPVARDELGERHQGHGHHFVSVSHTRLT